jgi:diguanylate cyclase
LGVGGAAAGIDRPGRPAARGGRAAALADELAGLAGRLAEDGATPELAGAVAEVCGRARRLLAHRHHLLDQVHRLSQELAGGLAELSEDESWVQGQLAGLKERLGETPNARGVQAAAQLLAETRPGSRPCARSASRPARP